MRVGVGLDTSSFKVISCVKFTLFSSGKPKFSSEEQDIKIGEIPNIRKPNNKKFFSHRAIILNCLQCKYTIYIVYKVVLFYFFSLLCRKNINIIYLHIQFKLYKHGKDLLFIKRL